MRLLQGNLCHSPSSQHLLQQTMVEWHVGLAVVAEPWRVDPQHPHWVGDDAQQVAITWTPRPGSPPVVRRGGGSGYVAVEWGDILVVGVYTPPRYDLATFEECLGGVGRFISRHLRRPLLVLGDFNAHAAAWGCPRTDRRGEALEEWAASWDLLLLNRGSRSTFVGARGESIIDISWASAAAASRVSGWRVAEEVVTLSDHLHIMMEVSATPTDPAAPPRRPPGIPPKRWALTGMNPDMLAAAAEAVAWGREPDNLLASAEGAVWFRGALQDICDVAMPRARGPSRKKAVYWWSGGIAQLRNRCKFARRQYTRARRRRGASPDEIAGLRQTYNTAAGALKAAIREAKARSWTELVETIDGDPWGRPYKIVTRKLRPWAPPITETLDPQFLGEVIGRLFPSDEELPPRGAADPPTWSAEWDVSAGELDLAIGRMQRKNTAPGPDGVPGKVLARALRPLSGHLRGLLSRCLQQGVFPAIWKRANLVLLRKPGRPEDEPSAYRPICLLDEAGKLFERIIAERLVGHLSRRGPDLSENQFGFRQGRSTLDALMRVRSLAEGVSSRGGVALLINLDISNAFNTLPWAAIRGALAYHGVPQYIVAVLEDYLRERGIEYTGRDGRRHSRPLSRGVPQGSVLAPLLWLLGYDAALRTALPSGTSVVCYADDTYIVAGGRDYGRTAATAEVAVAAVLRRIRALGLEVAPQKTEAMWFFDPRLKGAPPEGARIQIGDVGVRVGPTVKCLGLTLDSQWRWDAHFGRVVPRALGMAAALRGLLPNLGGPGVVARRLYTGVTRSIVLYGAPVWSRDLRARPRGRAIALLRRVHRLMALRVARGYCTISHEAVGILAAVPPFELQAEGDAVRYDGVRRLRLEGGRDGRTAPDAAEAKRRALSAVREEWRRQLAVSRGRSGGLVGAVLPQLDEWLDRRVGALTFRLTQVLSGHGCFGEYLHRIGREVNPGCHHCAHNMDTAQHTLEECPAWSRQRRVLRAVVGHDLSLPALISAMLGSREAWAAAAAFSEGVIFAKEEAERGREQRDPARRGRRRRRPP